MIKSLFNLAGDLVETATAPVEIAADLTRTLTKPLAEAAREIKDGVKAVTAGDEPKDRAP